MARAVLALALLGLVICASAERSLFAHKPNGGTSLHGLAIATTPVSFVVNTVPGTTFINAVAAPTPSYFKTNGNGTWASSRNGALTTTSAAGNLATIFVSTSGAFLTAALSFGSGVTPDASILPTTAVAGVPGLTITAEVNYFATAQYSYFMPGSVIGLVGSPGFQQGSAFYSSGALSPSLTGSVYASGITSVAFPSKTLGIAVGLGNQNAVTSTGTGVNIVNAVPNIITTYDMGASWNAVSGISTIPQMISALGQNTWFPYNAASQGATGSITSPTNYYSAPDLMDVFCVSRSLCFAAGGFMPIASVAATGLGNSIAALNLAPTPQTGDLPQWGQILRSTNGGTYWSYTPMPFNYLPNSPYCQITTPGPYFGLSICPTPGLLDISADASGKHVYAVGSFGLPTGSTHNLFPGQVVGYRQLVLGASGAAPAPTTQNPATPQTCTTTFGSVCSTIIFGSTATPATATVLSYTFIPPPVILYSGNSGTSYTVQPAPSQPNFYILNEVVVLRGTTAFACGGNPYGTVGALGQLITTTSATTAGAVSGVVNSNANGVHPLIGGNPQTNPNGNAGTFVLVQNVFTATTAILTTQVMAGAPIQPMNGVIIATINGGFSWVVQTIASYTYVCSSFNIFGPSNVVVAATCTANAAGCAIPALTTSTTVAAGIVNGQCSYAYNNLPIPYTPIGNQGAFNLPNVMSVAFTQSMGTYFGWAVGKAGIVLKTSFTQSQSQTIVNTPNSPVTSWAVVRGSAITSSVYLSAGSGGYQNLYGIVWDNANVGYIFGMSLILSTHDMGVTWAVETPNTLITSTIIPVVALAMVPTTY